MNCMEARRMVAPFVKKELSDKELEQFLKHIEHCGDCMDELDIYFTVYKALVTLDTGMHQDYNFQKMLQEEIRSAKRTVVARRTACIFRRMILVAAEILLIFSVYTGIEMRSGDQVQRMLQHAVHSFFSEDTGELGEG